MSKAERTKAYIIEKTAPLFNTKGYAGTSLTDITEATGLTKGSIYGNFGNKDEVALAAFDYNLQKVNRIVQSEVGGKPTVKDKLLCYVQVYNDFLKHPFPEGGCPILNTAVEADDTHPQLKEKAKEAVISWKNALVSLIEEGVATGELKAGVDAEQVALTIIATIEGAIMITNLTGKLNYRSKIMDSVKKLIADLE